MASVNCTSDNSTRVFKFESFIKSGIDIAEPIDLHLKLYKKHAGHFL
jgi:hypothetical protein